MIDLETWGRQPNGAIASIGAVCFNLEDGIIDKFYKIIDVTDAIESGGTFHPETMKWWFAQSEEARKEMMSGKELLKPSLIKFTDWYNKHNATRIWARNVIFDITILTTMFRKLKLMPPYHYREVRDVYALADFNFPILVTKAIKRLQTTDIIWHNALQDAAYQTEELLIQLRFLHATNY